MRLQSQASSSVSKLQFAGGYPVLDEQTLGLPRQRLTVSAM
jgi:hypothetical protein